MSGEEGDLDERGSGLEDVFGRPEREEPEDAEASVEPRDSTEPEETEDTNETVEALETEETVERNDGTETEQPLTTPKSSQSKVARENSEARIFVPEDELEKFNRTYKRLNLEMDEEYGVDIEKNRHFHRAVVRHAVKNPEAIQQEIEFLLEERS